MGDHMGCHVGNQKSHIGFFDRIGKDRIGLKKDRNDRISSCKFTVWEIF